MHMYTLQSLQIKRSVYLSIYIYVYIYIVCNLFSIYMESCVHPEYGPTVHNVDFSSKALLLYATRLLGGLLEGTRNHLYIYTYIVFRIYPLQSPTYLGSLSEAPLSQRGPLLRVPPRVRGSTTTERWQARSSHRQALDGSIFNKYVFICLQHHLQEAKVVSCASVVIHAAFLTFIIHY